MTFDKLYKERTTLDNTSIDLTGWIILMDNNLYLLEDNYKPDYRVCKKINIENRDIAYVLEKIVSPLGGTESFLFHRAIVSGMIASFPDLTIIPSEIYVEGSNKELEKVDISKENIERCKANSSDLFDTTKNIGNWFDV